jgi:phytoene dehydrogenase-like protein
VFLCGAGTYPGGSVIGINGRNAAMEILGRGDRAELSVHRGSSDVS